MVTQIKYFGALIAFKQETPFSVQPVFLLQTIRGIILSNFLEGRAVVTAGTPKCGTKKVFAQHIQQRKYKYQFHHKRNIFLIRKCNLLFGFISGSSNCRR
jgi:hypothetical protein